jgi:hypothetical protein
VALLRFATHDFEPVKVSITSAGDTTIKAAPGSGRKVVLAGFSLCSHHTSQKIKFTSAAGGTEITGRFSLPGGTTVTVAPPWGVCETAENQALVLNLTTLQEIELGGVCWVAVVPATQ